MRSAIISACPTPTWSASSRKPRPKALPGRGVGIAGDVNDDRLLQLGVFRAIATGTARADLGELLLRLGEVALLQIALTEIFARFGIVRVKRQGLMVVVDALVEVAELACGVADGAQHPRLLFVLDVEEELQRVFVMPFLAEVASGKIE